MKQVGRWFVGVAMLCMVFVADWIGSGQAWAATGTTINQQVIDASFVHGSVAAGAQDDSGALVWSVAGTWRQPFTATVMVTEITAAGEVPANTARLSGGVDAMGLVNGVVLLPAATQRNFPSFELRVANPQPGEIFAVHVLTQQDDARLVQSSVGAGKVIEQTVF